MRSDPSLGYMSDVYNSLVREGYRFPSAAAAPAPASKPSAASAPKAATRTTKEEEDEELQLAVGLIVPTELPFGFLTSIPSSFQLALSLSEFESRDNQSKSPSKDSAQNSTPKVRTAVFKTL